MINSYNFKKIKSVKTDIFERFDANLILKRIGLIFFSILILLILIIISIGVGTVSFSIREIVQILFTDSTNNLGNQIIRNVRIPRILTAILVGMNLSVAGALLQGVLRNPMASPNIIGVNAGAGLGAVICMIFLPGYLSLLPMSAFLGALLATTIIFLLSFTNKGMNNTVTIVLAGVALSSFLNAITSGLMMLNPDELQVTHTWLLGTLSGKGWNQFYSFLPYSIIGLSLAIVISPKINIFALGDEIGDTLGISIKFYRIIIIFIASFLAGSAVSIGGTIGFIGLIGPHISKALIGEDYRFLIPFSALVGGILLLASDTIARTIFSPLELSVGIVTSLLGAPFFLYLLYKKANKK